VKVLISGGGIAGPTLAYWLQKSGHEVLLVEQSPQLRSGGYVIDFWGVGYDIAEKMGLIPRIRELGYQVREVRYVDEHGRKRGGFAVDVFSRMTNGRFTSLPRSELAATIYHTIDGKVETVFGDSIARIEDGTNSVRVSFAHAAPREVDLVIGADGRCWQTSLPMSAGRVHGFSRRWRGSTTSTSTASARFAWIAGRKVARR
jgi:2-polyprenyl-6-methoxyphenol hydroxylase-like FAD-dependent oxidoreductase